MITWAALPIGAVKASVVATVITTTLAYFANRYWTYRAPHPTALRREYTLFFGFNLVGMVIQSGAVAIAKYGFGLTEEHDTSCAFMGVTLVGVGRGDGVPLLGVPDVRLPQAAGRRPRGRDRRAGRGRRPGRAQRRDRASPQDRRELTLDDARVSAGQR